MVMQAFLELIKEPPTLLVVRNRRPTRMLNVCLDHECHVQRPTRRLNVCFDLERHASKLEAQNVELKRVFMRAVALRSLLSPEFTWLVLRVASITPNYCRPSDNEHTTGSKVMSLN